MRFFPTAGRRCMTTGWAISRTGASPARSGGGIACRCGSKIVTIDDTRSMPMCSAGASLLVQLLRENEEAGPRGALVRERDVSRVILTDYGFRAPTRRTIRTCSTSMWPPLPVPTNAVWRSMASSKTPTCSTPGSAPGSGLSRPWAGRRRRTTLEAFYPTTDLVTGPDIIFFWVARMIMAGYE